MEVAAYKSLGDFYRRGPHAPVVNAIREPAGSPLQLIHLLQPAGSRTNPAMDAVQIHCIRHGNGSCSAMTGGTRFRTEFRPGRIAVARHGAEASFAMEAPADLLVAGVPLAAVNRIVDSADLPAFNDFGRLHDEAFDDPFVSSLVERIWAEASNDTPRGRLFLDGAVLALLTSLLAKSEDRSLSDVTPAPRRGGLPPYRLRRVEELAMAHLADDLSLDALAEAAGLSTFHFARAFRAEMGTSPHAWLLDRRIARAKELLAGTTMTVDEVARQVGFARANGLIGAFKRVVGTTPQAWRNAS